MFCFQCCPSKYHPTPVAQAINKSLSDYLYVFHHSYQEVLPLQWNSNPFFYFLTTIVPACQTTGISSFPNVHISFLNQVETHSLWGSCNLMCGITHIQTQKPGNSKRILGVRQPKLNSTKCVAALRPAELYKHCGFEYSTCILLLCRPSYYKSH